jgi:hypothetical protein
MADVNEEIVTQYLKIVKHWFYIVLTEKVYYEHELYFNLYV